LARAHNSDRLGLGIPVLGLGYSVLRSQTIAEIARGPMQDVAERFQTALSLGTPSGLEIIFLQRCQSRATSLTDLRVGMKMPIAHSASGWVYLACLPEEKREALLASIRSVEGAHWDYLEPRYKAAMASWPSTGFLLQKGLLRSDLNVVAVPVRGARDGEIFTLSGGGFASVFGDEILIALGHALVELADTLMNCLRDEAHEGARDVPAPQSR
jgi:DNA-binding IclR family transcriptional regulator